MTRAGRLGAGVVATLAGVAVLVWKIRDVGLDRIGDGFAAVGWWFLLIVALSGARYVVRAVAWVTLMGGVVPLRTALAATIAGDAVGTLTPLRLLASEPAKAVLLREHVDTPRALAALVVENVFYSLSVAIVIVVGTGAMLAEYVLPPDLRLAGWAAIGGMAAMIAVIAWVLWSRPALVGSLFRARPGSRLAAVATKLQDFETTTYGFVHGHASRLAVVALCEAVFHVLSFFETFVTLRLILPATTPLAAFILDSVNRVINIVFMAVPLRAGVAEEGTSLVAAAIGLDQAAVTLPLVSKGRMLVWAAIGMVFLGSRTISSRAAARVEKP